MFRFKTLKKIKKVIEYLPIIWNNEDYDYNYLIDLIVYKLKRMNKYFSNSNIIQLNEINKINKQIYTVLKYFDRYQNSDYHYKRIYPCEVEFEDRFTEDRLDWVYKGTNKLLTDEDKHKIYDYIANQWKFEAKSLRQAFKYMGRYIQHWWD